MIFPFSINFLEWTPKEEITGSQNKTRFMAFITKLVFRNSVLIYYNANCIVYECFLKGLSNIEFNIFNLISQLILLSYYFSVVIYIKNY